MRLNRILPIVLLCAAATGFAAPQDGSSDAVVQQLLERATRSLDEKDLGLAMLRYEQALRLDPPQAQASPLGQRLDEAGERVQALLEAGLQAAQARDRAAVRRTVVTLQALDRHSSAALLVVLRYQAALADHGGAFPRVRWQQLRDTGPARTPGQVASNPPRAAGTGARPEGQ